MNSDLERTNDIQDRLEKFYQQGEPSVAFLDALEAKLNRAPRLTRMQSPEPMRSKRRPLHFRWAGAAILAVLIVGIAVLAIRPKQVFAQMQALIGYIPGFGFVDTGDTRVILQPVSQTKGEFTITVKQVISNQDGTYVMLEVDGLPPEDEIYDNLHQFIREHEQEWPQMEPEMWQTEASITLPGGTVLDDQYFSGAPWAGHYLFPPLPEDVLEIEFAMDRVAGLIPDIAPHDWAFHLQLGYVTEAGSVPTIEAYVDQAPSFDPVLLTPVPVDVPSEADPTYGFKLELIEAIYAQTETALRVSIGGKPENWLDINSAFESRLVDDLGNVYPFLYGPAFGMQPDGSSLLTFEPLLPGAKSLTLSLAQVAFYVPVGPQAIVVNFGESPQLGDHFPLDQTIEVLGTPIRITGLRIGQEEVHTAERTLLNVYEFEIEPVPVRDGISIVGIGFTSDVMERLGSSFAAGGGGGGGVKEDTGFKPLSLSIGIPASVPLPVGPFEFTVDSSSVVLAGPYSITWDIEP